LDNSGTISLKEFSKGVVNLGINVFSTQQLKELFTFYDADQNGTLDYKEFAKIVYGSVSISKNKVDDSRLSSQNAKLLKELSSAGMRSIFRLLRAFNDADTDKNGSIPIASVLETLKD